MAAGTPGPAATVAENGGDGYNAVAGSATSVPPSVKVTDANGHVVGGVSVTFAVASGGGSIAGGNATTTGAGLATAGSWTLATTP